MVEVGELFVGVVQLAEVVELFVVAEKAVEAAVAGAVDC